MPKNKTVMDLSAHTPRARSRMVADDRGIMIIEVVVSAVLLVVMSLATLAVIDRAGALSGENRARTVAATLAQQDQDIVRQWPFSRVDALFGGNSSTTQPPKTAHPAPLSIDVDGTTYTVQTELKVVPDDESENTACLAGWKNRKIQITTTATPPPGTGAPDVKLETSRVPSILDTSEKGGVIVRLIRGDGDPTVGVPVTVVGKGTKNTDDDGCAVFNDVDPASAVTVSWGDQTGPNVDENGARLVTRTFTLLKGSTAQFASRFDGAKNPVLTYVDENGNETTSDGKQIVWNSVSAIQSGISTVYNGWRSWRTDAPAHQRTEASGLFPFESPYGIIAGSCWGNDPTAWDAPSVTSNAVLLNRPALDIGKIVMPTATFILPGAGYRAFVAPERRVTKMGMGKCTPNQDTIMDGILPPNAPDSREAAPYKTTGVDGVPATKIEYALPYGIWRVCIDKITAPTRRYNKVLRINNTPPNTPGDPNNPAQYAPKRTIDVSAAPAGNWQSGEVCSGGTDSGGWDADRWPWVDYNQKVNPTDR